MTEAFDYSTGPEPTPTTEPWTNESQELPLVSTKTMKAIFSERPEMEGTEVTEGMAHDIIVSANTMTPAEVADKRRELNRAWFASTLKDVPLQLERSEGRAPMQVVDPVRYSLATRRLKHQLNRLDLISSLQSDATRK